MGGCCSEAEKYGRRCRISGSSRSFAANVSFPGLDLQNAKCAHCRMTELHSIIIGLGRNRLELADSLPTASPLPKQTAEPPVKERAWSLCLFCVFFLSLAYCFRWRPHVTTLQTNRWMLQIPSLPSRLGRRRARPGA